MNGYELYQEARIESADPIELVALLYDGAIDAVRRARFCLAQGDIEGRGRAISKTAAIILELSGSLDHQSGGELSQRLADLYAYIQQRLSEAHLKQKDEPLAESERLLTTLSEGWRQARNPEPEYGSYVFAEPLAQSLSLVL
jgi:flagellar protein FliS